MYIVIAQGRNVKDMVTAKNVRPIMQKGRNLHTAKKRRKKYLDL